MAVVQVFLGVFRPHLTATKRPVWNHVHWYWGRVLIITAVANIIIGIVLGHRIRNQPYAAWLVPTLVVLAGWVVVFVMLELRKSKVGVQTQVIEHNPMHAMVCQACNVHQALVLGTVSAVQRCSVAVGNITWSFITRSFLMQVERRGQYNPRTHQYVADGKADVVAHSSIEAVAGPTRRHAEDKGPIHNV